jgi:hypothetical protein
MSLPATDRAQKRDATVIDLIGNTPLLRLKRFETGLRTSALRQGGMVQSWRIGERSPGDQHGA